MKKKIEKLLRKCLVTAEILLSMKRKKTFDIIYGEKHKQSEFNKKIPQKPKFLAENSTIKTQYLQKTTLMAHYKMKISIFTFYCPFSANLKLGMYK